MALHCAHNDIRLIVNATTSLGIIDLLELIDQEVPLHGRRWVVGHVGRLSPHDIERIVRMGLVITPHTNSSILKARLSFYRRSSKRKSANRLQCESMRGEGLSTGAAARLCSVNPDTVLKWIKKGRLPATRTVGGHYRIEEQDLAALIPAHAVSGVAAHELPEADNSPLRRLPTGSA